LWLNIGGSAGFASLWAVDIVEGKYPDPRRWEVSLYHAAQAREQAAEQQEQTKSENRERKHNAKVETAKTAIADALRNQWTGTRTPSGALGSVPGAKVPHSTPPSPT
jgi:hypothetical protein